MTTYLEALDALAYSRPGLDYANYGDAASFRADQRANMRDAADYRLLRLYVAPTDAELSEAARGSRLSFLPRVSMEHRVCAPARDGLQVTADYCACQYYPREYRAACVRLLARVWWARQAGTTDDIRRQAARVFGRGIARRWFS